jgi:Rap1a immunity proteins
MIMLALVLATSAQVRGEDKSADNSANHWLPLCKTWVRIDETAAGEIAEIARRDMYRLTEIGECVGQVIGIGTWLRDLGQMCPPKEVTIGQTIRMIVKEVESHPDQLHQDFALHAGAVMIKSWPCRK